MALKQHHIDAPSTSAHADPRINNARRYLRKLWTETARVTAKVAKENPSPHFRFRFRYIANIDHPECHRERKRQNKVAVELMKLGVDGSQLEWEGEDA
jgi:hypothetical protein